MLGVQPRMLPAAWNLSILGVLGASQPAPHRFPRGERADADTMEARVEKTPGLERRVRQQAIAVGVASVLLKEALYRATLTAGEQVQSNLAVATAWHHRSDSLAAAVALASQLGTALTNCPGLDSLGGGVVAAMLGYSAVDSLHDSLNDLLDYNRAAEDDGEGEGRMSCCSGAALARTITQVQGVRNHTLRTRRMGPFCLVDVTIIVDARISASAASMIAENVHDHVIYEFRPAVTDVRLLAVTQTGHTLGGHHELSYGVSLERKGSASTVAEHFETVEMLNPEALLQVTGQKLAQELEAQIRAALLEASLTRKWEAGADLPKIAEVTELHTYYYMEDMHRRASTAPERLLDFGDGLNGEDVVVTPESNGVFNVTLLMDGHGGQGIMKRSLDLQQGLLNACRVAADWPKCAREAVQNFQDRARQMQYRGGATLLALLTEERSSRVAFAWAGDSMAILVKQGLFCRLEAPPWPRQGHEAMPAEPWPLSQVDVDRPQPDVPVSDAESVPELRYCCLCGTCVASSDGFQEARGDQMIFRSLAAELKMALA
ncbi:unnamed protein product [Effrenium voratum]|nr:unnamed protein product [Effrenium voratum]